MCSVEQAKCASSTHHAAVYTAPAESAGISAYVCIYIYVDLHNNNFMHVCMHMHMLYMHSLFRQAQAPKPMRAYWIGNRKNVKA